MTERGLRCPSSGLGTGLGYTAWFPGSVEPCTSRPQLCINQVWCTSVNPARVGELCEYDGPTGQKDKI